MKLRKPGSRATWFVVGTLLLSLACSRPTKQTNQQFGPAPASASSQQSFNGRVVRIADGDTVTVLDANNTQQRIRLQGIDAPESHQDFGTKSKKNLSSLIFGKDVAVVYEKTDRYGRLVGKILLDGQDVNLEQIRAGMAWHYKDYEREQSIEDREIYARAESEARMARRGLWVNSNSVEPSEYRKEERRERKNAR
jgi:endonuclease YncB( thermonuclease family)